jgi:hypothetical protein
MAFVNSRVLDFGLNELTNTTALHICSQEPATYTEAITTYTLGNKASPTIGSIVAGSPSGRAITVSAITDGSVTATGTATHYALVDTVNSRLLLAQSLSASQAVTNGNTFTLSQITVTSPGV